MVHVVQMRVDAARNRARILRAGRDLVASDGAELTMETLARQAGVAVGTLYRHFPTKQDLVAAIIEESIDAIADLATAAADRVRSGAAAGPELAGLFRAVAGHFAADRAVKQTAAGLGVAPDVDVVAPPAGSATARATAALSVVLDAAKVSGAVDGSLTVADLAMLVSQVPTDPTGHARERYIQIVLAGLLRE